ncbi:ribonuclease Z [Macrococcus armenti]|uniref:Ribonuclease Z n=1 Tax=Macrococcus armenti TaxID=2875764 RepID=A0ABY3ZS96_9STAP|nr:ribonuclease Z [Macrococcus armenti]UOB19693.1 ribonuclease Z [Macrococcus armenti]
MKIICLGTSAGLPTKERNTQTTVLSLNPHYNEYWMFDCGEAAQHQILHTNIKLGKLTRIFITHLHGDHIFGLPGILTSRSFQGGEHKPLTIYGPVGIRAFVETTLEVSASHLNYPLEIIEVVDKQCFQIHDINIKVGLLKHGVPSFGYRVKMPDIQGNLMKEKLIEQGILPGPIYKQFKNNAVVTIDNITYDTAQFKTESKKGKVLVFYGDTMPCENEMILAHDADVIVHECTYLDGDIDLSHKYFHSHFEDVKQLVIQCNVKHLIINHVSNRYAREDIQCLLSEIEHQLNCTVHIADDFYTYELN